MARAGHTGKDLDYRGGFAKFRQTHLGNPSTWFQQQFVSDLEACAEGRSSVLWPPEHGKTTTIEDFLNYRLAMDPNSRITVVSERQDHAKRIVRRVRERMEHDGPTREMVLRFAPSSPAGERAHRQKWTTPPSTCGSGGRSTSTNGTSTFRPSASGPPSRGAVRLDDPRRHPGHQVHQPDPQYVEVIRQDFCPAPACSAGWCSWARGCRLRRLPEADGRGPGRLPHPVPGGEQHDRGGCGPSAYSEAQYLKAKKRWGASAWARNWLQRPTAAVDQAYNNDVMVTCADRTRSLAADPPRDPDRDGLVVPVVLSVDPPRQPQRDVGVCHHACSLSLLDYTVDEGCSAPTRSSTASRSTSTASTSPPCPRSRRW